MSALRDLPAACPAASHSDPVIPCDISSWEDLLYSDEHLHAGPEGSEPDLGPKPAPQLAHPDCRWTVNPFAPKLKAEAQLAPAPQSAPEAAPVPPSSSASDDCVRQSAFSGKRCKQCDAPAAKGNYGFCSQHRSAAAAVRHKPAASVASLELPSTHTEAQKSGSGCTDLVKPACKQPAERGNAKRSRETPITEPNAPKQARTAVCLELALPVGRARRRGQSAVSAEAVHACVRAGDVSDLEGLLHSGDAACSVRLIIQ